ncbi:hypothetical protein [Actinokineospora xionganensis]|uniref:Uncharacterized protein n=1 Tax=Actinokineospora xionganensis TaxID=2684470 RepID=A0ABR7L302_9PSEU|nr:hypothetical protein [Actinokineospora xionganensis]MBC6446766.1 hypothetical protein [Actinokineospora xionganensis]
MGQETFLWTQREKSVFRQDGPVSCAVVSLRKSGSRGHLRIVFDHGDGQDPPKAVRMENWIFYARRDDPDSDKPRYSVEVLDVPGVVRHLLDEARGQGWSPDDSRTAELDGWMLIEPLLDQLRSQA